jgi:hypothetical protein
MFSIQGSTIDLDAAYPKITPGSWIALISNEATIHPSGFSGYVELYQAKAVSFPSRTDFGLSGGHPHPAGHRRESGRLPLPPASEPGAGQSEPLAVSETPLGYRSMAHARTRPVGADIAAGRALALSGKRACALRKGEPDVAMPLTQGGSVAIGGRSPPAGST